MPPTSVTEILQRIERGEPGAHEALVQRVHVELRRLARAHLARGGSSAGLQPTELMNEAYVRLLAVEDPRFESRHQFFGLVSCIMRGLLADLARRRAAHKRGGLWDRATLEVEQLAAAPDSQVDLLDLAAALEELARLDPTLGRCAELRYLAGLSVKEISDQLAAPMRTVERKLAVATAWLRDRLGHDRP